MSNIQPGRYDFRITQGQDWEMPVTLRQPGGDPVDLTGYSAKLTIDEDFDSTTTELALTTGGGGIVISGTDGKVTVTITATQSAGLAVDTSTVTKGQTQWPVEYYPYQLELTDSNGETTVYLHGWFEVQAEVTN